uniref:Uncharacterized protein n=1 Tax=Trichuris muris TaxID=70415 RepID=A0A5S6QL55_TRIMR
MWSVYDCVLAGLPRTQNSIEAWHRRWETVVGESHVSVYRLLEEIRMEQRRVEIDCERYLRGQPSAQPKKMDNSSKRTCREERLLDKTDQRGEPNSRGNGPVGKEEYLGELPRTENRIIEGMDLSDKRLSGKRLSGK